LHLSVAGGNIIGMTLEEIIIAAGGASELARIAGVHRATVSATWRRRGKVPVERARAISDALQIPLHKIRPDIWRAEVVA
jgi:DNA-binding transcriptional regulator YdaS (Cro superfamily)